jgi:hypothetical protein
VMPEAYQEAHPLIVKNLPHGQQNAMLEASDRR